MERALLVVRLHDERRARVQEPDEVASDIRARARSVSSVKINCSVGVAPRPPNSRGQLIPA